MSRLPSEAASRNMSACSAQAMSQVGCRLMVASSANTSRPLAPGWCGDIARALTTKAAISSAADGLASGNGLALRASAAFADATSPADFGLMGSPAMGSRYPQSALMWDGARQRSMHPISIRQRSTEPWLARTLVSDRLVGQRRIARQRDRSRAVGQNVGHLGWHPPQRTGVGSFQGFVEQGLDRGFLCVRPGVRPVVLVEVAI